MPEVVDTGSERPPLTVVGTENEPVPSPLSNNSPAPARQRASDRTKVGSSKSQPRSGTVSIAVKRPDEIALPTDEELGGYRSALIHFRTVLQELVSGAIAGSEDFRGPLRLTRNPFAKLRRYFDQEPGFEELVGKYASLLPVLERPSGMIYSEMALIGIEALRARRLAISETVYDEVHYRTSTSATLATVMKGFFLFIVLFLIVGAIIPAVSFAALKWSGVPSETITNFLSPLFPMKMGIAVLFGCLGSAVSILLRMDEFEGTKGRSKWFLLLYGGTLPIVGGIFAAVISALLDLDIINITHNSPETYIVVGFLSGFSERFTRSILNMAEDRLSPEMPRPNDERLKPRSSV
jgi:hypothetical protein